MKDIAIGTSRSRLVLRFAAARLPLELADEPIGRVSSTDIFGMDIQRKLSRDWRTEYFRIWPGHVRNRIEVLGTDNRLCQLVLLVHEPARFFETRVPKRALPAGDQRIVRADGQFHWIIRERTPDFKRHYLCGVDERQLFIAELPRGVSTVRDAHRVLKADEVLLAEGKRRVTRQGEWFFLELTPEEDQRLSAALPTAIVERRRPVGLGGHPHTADEVVRLPGLRLEHGHPVRSFDVFARGRVRHVDHKTVVLAHWHKVVRNTEPNAGRMATIAWID